VWRNISSFCDLIGRIVLSRFVSLFPLWYHFSKDWVFPGWIGFSQWFKEEFGVYPPRESLVELGRMSKAEREENTWFGPYLWEKKRLVGKNIV